jgi:hypothetical protein
MPQFGASLTIVTDNTNKTFIVQPSLTIITYDHHNIYIVRATDKYALKSNLVKLALAPRAAKAEKKIVSIYCHNDQGAKVSTGAIITKLFTAISYESL